MLDSRRQAIHSMFLGMRADSDETDFFRRVINVRKGIQLISRLLPMLEPVSTETSFLVVLYFFNFKYAQSLLIIKVLLKSLPFIMHLRVKNNLPGI